MRPGHSHFSFEQTFDEVPQGSTDPWYRQGKGGPEKESDLPRVQPGAKTRARPLDLQTVARARTPDGPVQSASHAPSSGPHTHLTGFHVKYY